MKHAPYVMSEEWWRQMDKIQKVPIHFWADSNGAKKKSKKSSKSSDSEDKDEIDKRKFKCYLNPLDDTSEEYEVKFTPLENIDSPEDWCLFRQKTIKLFEGLGINTDTDPVTQRPTDAYATKRYHI